MITTIMMTMITMITTITCAQSSNEYLLEQEMELLAKYDLLRTDSMPITILLSYTPSSKRASGATRIVCHV